MVRKEESLSRSESIDEPWLDDVVTYIAACARHNNSDLRAMDILFDIFDPSSQYWRGTKIIPQKGEAQQIACDQLKTYGSANKIEKGLEGDQIIDRLYHKMVRTEFINEDSGKLNIDEKYEKVKSKWVEYLERITLEAMEYKRTLDSQDAKKRFTNPLVSMAMANVFFNEMPMPTDNGKYTLGNTKIQSRLSRIILSGRQLKNKYRISSVGNVRDNHQERRERHKSDTVTSRIVNANRGFANIDNPINDIGKDSSQKTDGGLWAQTDIGEDNGQGTAYIAKDEYSGLKMLVISDAVSSSDDDKEASQLILNKLIDWFEQIPGSVEPGDLSGKGMKKFFYENPKSLEEAVKVKLTDIAREINERYRANTNKFGMCFCM